MAPIGVGIIGTGFMGKAHALAYQTAASLFPLPERPVLEMVADQDQAGAQRAFESFRFRRMTVDWRQLVADPAVRIVSVATPTALHHEMALAAIAAGKHVHCEKPLAENEAKARELVVAAEAAGVSTQVGFNYLKNPLLSLARTMIESGELGEITSFRGIHAECYMADPNAPFTWRLEPPGGGALADLGSHIIGLARYLLGPITSICAELETVIKERPIEGRPVARRTVAVDDIARLMVRFARGMGGTIEASWVASGRTMQLAFEIFGSKGALAFSQERMNELLFYRADRPPARGGFVRIETGPEHPPYGLFCPAPGHQLGFNDLKTIEAAGFLAEISGGPAVGPDFREGWEVQKVIETARHSSAARTWLPIP